MSKIDVFLAYPPEPRGPQEPPELAPPGPPDLQVPDPEDPDYQPIDDEELEVDEDETVYVLSGDADTAESVAAYHRAATAYRP